MNGASTSLTEQFSHLKDPRVDRTKRHKLTDVIAIAICAVICGANGWTDVELFCRRGGLCACAQGESA